MSRWSVLRRLSWIALCCACALASERVLAQDDELDDLGDDLLAEDPEGEEASSEDLADEGLADEDLESESTEEEQGEGEVLDSSDQPSEQPVADADNESREEDLSIQLGIGGGVGTRGFQRPTPVGLQQLPDTPFAAVELLARLHIWPTADFSLETLLTYHTSVGFSVAESPPFALDQEVAARSSRAELSVAPSFRLGESSRAVRLVFPLGFAMQMFTPEVDYYRTPSYILAGPLARAELVAYLGDLVRLRIGPELQWITLINGTVLTDGACCQGVGLGGQGAIEALVGERVSIGIGYRELHSFAPSEGAAFIDIERLLTTRLSGVL